MDYLCDWHAPVLAEPDSMTGGIDSETLLITAGGVQGLGLPPLFGNSVFHVPNVLLNLSHTYFHDRCKSLDGIHRPFEWESIL